MKKWRPGCNDLQIIGAEGQRHAGGVAERGWCQECHHACHMEDVGGVA
jgi:hypothetical protein